MTDEPCVFDVLSTAIDQELFWRYVFYCDLALGRPADKDHVVHGLFYLDHLAAGRIYGLTVFGALAVLV